LSLGARGLELEQIMIQLIEENYLNEERFAIQFAGGKFRTKQWGRLKIINHLKQHQISEYCIRQALKQIEDDEYRKTLRKIAEKKWSSIPAGNHDTKLQKLKSYLIAKGYEWEWIAELPYFQKNS
jgi:Uncharacterized protein conserved in bacteria